MDYNLTNPQNSILLTEKFYSNTSINNICGYTYISDKVNFEILTKAINKVIETNDAMRIIIKDSDDFCTQSFVEFKELNFDIINLNSQDDVYNKSLELAKIPFNIKDNTELFKFILYKLPDSTGGFFLNAHHLIGDSWGLGLVVKEIMKIYSSLLNNLPEDPISYSYVNYIKNENEYLESDKFNKDKKFWNSLFSTVPEIATIPSIKNNKNISCSGNRLNFKISPENVLKINEYCKEKKISLYNFFMGIYSIYLGRVSNLDDFVIGTPILNRTNFEQKHTVGMFISTAPLRINLDNDLSFSTFVKNIAVNTLSLFRHQKYPYQYLLDDLRKKDSSLPNLYNVILSYQITKTFDASSNIQYSAEWVNNGCCADDLQIHIFDLNAENSLTVAYDYKTDKYDEQDIKDLNARILTIINQVLSNNNIFLKDIEIVTPEEKHKILYDFNNTKVDYPKDKTIVDLFEEQVEKTPDNIAVVFEDEKLTYKELNEKANQLARYLIDYGIEKNSIIALRLDKSLEMIIGILSIIKIGCAYLPINMSYPKERVEYMLQDSNANAVLTLNNSNTEIDFCIPNIKINLSNQFIYSGDSRNLKTSISIEDLIYIIYTSGSTGKPKGAMLCHRNVVRLMKNKKFLFDFNSSDIWTMFHSFSFDFSVWEMYGALLYGGKLIIVNDNITKDPYLFLQLLRKEQVTVLNQTPSYFYNLQKVELTFNNSELKLRYIIFGGEALNPQLIKKWNEKYPNVSLINMYGITETTVHVTFKKLTKNDFNNSSSNIGRPIPTLHVLVLDKFLNIMPFGTLGEICVLGDGIFKGYLNNSNLNSQKLINCSKYNNQLIYRSGDTAIMHKDGHLEYFGRIDNQVKIRGFRVELGEIEEKILKYSNISRCIVCKKEDSNRNSILCAYYIKSGPISITALKKQLSRNLPPYMIPQYFIEIPEIPININGKADIKSLPLPSYIEKQTKYVPARNKYDKLILNTYKKLLKINNISILDSFYSIGGDSLIAISSALELSRKLNTNILTQDILNHPIISDLSDYISNLQNSSNTSITSSRKQDSYPISSAQKRIYYSCSLDKDSTLYNISGGIIFDNNLNIKKLEKCFEILISRHDSLRTHFDIINNEVVQIINDNIEFKIQTENSNEEDLNKIYESFVKPFDLTKAPLFRVNIVNLNNNKMLLLLDMHHIISDGTSLNILLQELSTLYNDGILPNKKIDYKDFTIWEQKQFNTDKFNISKEYWVNQFRDEIPLLNMPTVYSRPSSQSFEGHNYHSKLSKDTFEKINLLAKKLNITPYMLMLSCYYILLSKYTSQDDIVIGTPIIGRELSELSNIVGMFVNSLPLRNKIDHSLTFKEFCNDIKDNCINSFKNQNYPFDMLVKDLELKRDTSRNPLFDVMFVFQNEGYPSIDFNGINSEYFIPDNNISKFDLTLEIIPINNEYEMRFEYCTKLFNKDFIQRLASHYINILNEILNNSEIKIADIDMLSEKEKQQILYDFNNTKVDYPKNKTIIDLFEEQVNKTPDNVAVVFENEKLTYKELNEKANQLARFLISNNAGLGDIIGILLDKSLDIIISILGILKIGATFLPIDINYPSERVDYMIRDSKINLLLTSTPYMHKVNDTVQALTIESNNTIFLQFDSLNLNIKYDPNNIAYIMYTSGSTGNPKGVMVTHKNIVRLVKNNNFIKFNKNEHILQTGSIVFDACTFEIWGALLNGFGLYVIKKENLLDPLKFAEYLKINNITTLWLTAPLFNQLSEAKPDMFKSVTKLLTGGDVLSPKHINAVIKSCPSLMIINGYGPTENTTFSCCFTIDKMYKNSIPIGKPISNSTAYIMSKDSSLLPIGIPGELWVGGDGVSNGYLNNPELTQEKFVDNPFGNGKIYKTGDLVKWLPDGNIEFIGRIDNQVKIRGFRIELNEINEKILSNQYIKESFTTINIINNSKQICSYIVTKNNFNLEDLKSYLKLYLPEYMLPTYFIKLKKLPMNPNGKVDKKALPTKTQNFIDGKHIKIATTDNEKLLLSLFKKVLNNDNIGISDSFFDVGGDSLTAMKLQVEAISNNLNISYADIFKYNTVENIIKNLYTINNEKKLNNNDFKQYNSLLINNTLKKDIICTNCDVGNILLTGFTGFLGAHVLDSFIKKENGNIYCLIRSKNNMSAKERLYNVLHFYFDNKYDELVDKRIFVLEGDISEKQLGLSNLDYLDLGKNINTVIHSAALVKHYGIYSDFEKINVFGTQNIVDFSLTFDLKLLHISTISVSGNNLAEGSNISNNFEIEKDFDDSNFYIGQHLENLYVKSKFEAEKIVLDAIKKGLSASILRMGNLTSRFSEGKFQQNHFENAFVNRFKSFLQIGIFPKSLLNLYCEFTPIDYCGDAIINIASHFNKKYTVFHLLNEKQVNLDRLFNMLTELGIHIKLVTDKEFASSIQKILKDDMHKQSLEGIINDLNLDKKLVYKSDVNIKSDFTKEFLYKTGFEWPYIDINYIRNYFKYLIDIGYFNVEIN